MNNDEEYANFGRAVHGYIHSDKGTMDICSAAYLRELAEDWHLAPPNQPVTIKSLEEAAQAATDRKYVWASAAVMAEYRERIASARDPDGGVPPENQVII